MDLPNIEFLIKSDGQINIGHIRPVGCVAIANNESGTLAMLKIKPKESLEDLYVPNIHAAFGR